jgi:hypothetical protein
MKKYKFLIACLVLAGLIIGGSYVFASGGNYSKYPAFFNRSNGALLLVNPNDTIGNSANRIPAIYTDSLDAGTIVINSAVSGDMDFGGYDITNIGGVESNSATTTDTLYVGGDGNFTGAQATTTITGTFKVANNSLDASQINLNTRWMQFGPTFYPANYVTACDNCSYFVMDKDATADDTSIVFRDQGNARAEIGLIGDNSLHIKTVTGDFGSESFSDALIATGQKVGIGGITPANTALEVLGTASSTQVTVSGDNGTLNMTANTDGGDYNIFTSNGTQTLALYGTAGNVLNLGLLDGNLSIDAGYASSTTGLFTQGDSHIGGDLTVDGTINGADIKMANGFILTEGDKVGMDENNFVVLNQNGKIIVVIDENGNIHNDQMDKLEQRLNALENRVGVIERFINWFKNLFNKASS